jgi:hypothetical protein
MTAMAANSVATIMMIRARIVYVLVVFIEHHVLGSPAGFGPPEPDGGHRARDARTRPLHYMSAVARRCCILAPVAARCCRRCGGVTR